MQFAPMLLVAAAGVQAVGQVMQGQAAASAGAAEADYLNRGATLVRQQGGAREELVRRQSTRQLGEQRAAVAQSGFVPDAGSIVDLQAESFQNAELDALTTRYQAELQALGHENDARMARWRGRVAKRQGFMNAAGTLLGAAGSYYGAQPKLHSQYGHF